jgi:hypothetical protein
VAGGVGVVAAKHVGDRLAKMLGGPEVDVDAADVLGLDDSDQAFTPLL